MNGDDMAGAHTVILDAAPMGHIATHPARPVRVFPHCTCPKCPPPDEQYAGAHHSDPDVYLTGRVHPAVAMTARRLSMSLELSRLMGRPQ